MAYESGHQYLLTRILGIVHASFSGDEAQSSTTDKQSTIFSGDKSVDKDTGDCSFFSGDEAQSSTTGKQSILFSGDKSADKDTGIVQSSQEI